MVEEWGGWVGWVGLGFEDGRVDDDEKMRLWVVLI